MDDVDEVTVSGVDDEFGRPYTAVLNVGGDPKQASLPPWLAIQMPPDGTVVSAGPNAWSVPLDRTDMATVWTWLRGSTTVVAASAELIPPGVFDDEPSDDADADAATILY